jgi:hypothetical protein
VSSRWKGEEDQEKARGARGLSSWFGRAPIKPGGGRLFWKEIGLGLGLGLGFGFFVFPLNMQNCPPSCVCCGD